MALKTFHFVPGLSRTPSLFFPRYLTNIFSKKKTKNQETLHKSGPGLMFMGFWWVGMVRNSSRTHPPLLSRDLTLLNLRHINFLFIFSIFDALDACLMVHCSWLKPHGSWPREARGGSWLMARGRPGPGDPEARGAGPGPEVRLWVPRAEPALGHEP